MITYCSLLIKTLLITIKDNLSKTPPVFQNFVQICWHFLLSSRTVMKQNFPYSIYPAQLAFSASYATSSRKFCKDWSVKGRSTNFHPYLIKKCLKKYTHFVLKNISFLTNLFLNGSSFSSVTRAIIARFDQKRHHQISYGKIF